MPFHAHSLSRFRGDLLISLIGNFPGFLARSFATLDRRLVLNRRITHRSWEFLTRSSFSCPLWRPRPRRARQPSSPRIST